MSESPVLSSIFEGLEKIMTVESFRGLEDALEKRYLQLFQKIGIAEEPYALTHGGKELILPTYVNVPRYTLNSLMCPMNFVDEFKEILSLRSKLSEDSYYMHNGLASIRNNVNNCLELSEVIPSSLVTHFSIRKSAREFDKLSDSFIHFRDNNRDMFDRMKTIYAKNRLLTQ